MREQVEEAVAAIRPVLEAEGGRITVTDVDEATGVVTVDIAAVCGTCPVSTETLKLGIEGIIRDRVAGVTAVVRA